MGRKGPTRHMKREKTPPFWPIHRKEHVWAVRPSPGPHPIEASIPLLVILRDMLGYAKTRKEAKRLIKEGKILVDGRPRRDERFPVGLMDVVEIPDTGEAYRMLPAKGRRLTLHPIDGEERGFKLCRIIGKTTLKGGRTQLNLHDGRNIHLPDGGDQYRVNDVLKLAIPHQEILDHIRFEPGVIALVVGGRSAGAVGKLREIGSEPGRWRTAAIETRGGEVRTLLKYVFAIGREEPLISLPEAD
ncbi:MAG TPA: 30S ribosomal protein S4e [Candidatus Bathyarchaeota archaeon]|nr:30S ribosomal protein S4e [Candidatus Bathyarchaeota archaeon]